MRKQIERSKLAREKQLREEVEREKAALETRLIQYQVKFDSKAAHLASRSSV